VPTVFRSTIAVSLRLRSPALPFRSARQRSAPARKPTKFIEEAPPGGRVRHSSGTSTRTQGALAWLLQQLGRCALHVASYPCRVTGGGERRCGRACSTARVRPMALAIAHASRSPPLRRLELGTLLAAVQQPQHCLSKKKHVPRYRRVAAQQWVDLCLRPSNGGAEPAAIVLPPRPGSDEGRQWIQRLHAAPGFEQRIPVSGARGHAVPRRGRHVPGPDHNPPRRGPGSSRDVHRCPEPCGERVKGGAGGLGGVCLLACLLGCYRKEETQGRGV
jgi:hypothetical protein